tara:strand:+ start:193 stop:513 length:321 start_codon:yes stop_codon:yes gene_type:complete
MVTRNQMFVTVAEVFKIFQCGQFCEFALRASIAFRTCQDQIPYSINDITKAMLFQDIWKEVINIREALAFLESDILSTVEASAFLVSVEGVSAIGYILSSAFTLGK